jgi:hypothetical protein
MHTSFYFTTNFAVTFKQPDLIREIIEQYGADPNLKARYSCKTALHIAAKIGYIRCAEVLLELGGNFFRLFS